MPRFSESTYAQYFDTVVELAKRKGGVSRRDIMEKLGLSRVMTDSVIERLKLRKSKRKIGRTEFFHSSRGTAKVLANSAGVLVKPAAKKPAAKKSQSKKAQAAKPATKDTPDIDPQAIEVEVIEKSKIRELLAAEMAPVEFFTALKGLVN